MDNRYPKLNFPPVKLRAVHRDNDLCVWDEGRKIWLVLTPEEWVRRHVIGWLVAQGIELLRIAQEYPVEIEGQAQRADIVVIGADLKPSVLVECKAPTVPITGEVFEQATRYNAILRAPTVIITNGLDTRVFAFDGEQYIKKK